VYQPALSETATHRDSSRDSGADEQRQHQARVAHEGAAKDLDDDDHAEGKEAHANVGGAACTFKEESAAQQISKISDQKTMMTIMLKERKLMPT
jgi:hypothetical protein